jgi:hypothetical protein
MIKCRHCLFKYSDHEKFRTYGELFFHIKEYHLENNYTFYIDKDRRTTICELCYDVFRFKNTQKKIIEYGDKTYTMDSCKDCFKRSDDDWTIIVRHDYQVAEAMDYNEPNEDLWWHLVNDDIFISSEKNRDVHY